MSENYDSLAYYRIKQLEETNERLKSQLMEANDTLEKANRDRNDLLRKLDTECDKRRNLQKQLDTECKKKQDLQEQVDMVGKNYCEAAKRVGELVREKGYLKEQLDSLSTSLGRLRERYEEEVVCRRKWAKLAVSRNNQIEDLQHQLDILKHNTAEWVDPEACKLEGMEELWAMLGEMYAADPIEVSKIFGWFSINNIAHYTPDVKEFLKKYKAWKGCAEEKKKEETDDMRKWLSDFCVGRVCTECPLGSDKFKCGNGYSFNRRGRLDLKIIPDEDLKWYYEKARDWVKKEEEKPSEEVPCSFNWKLDGTEYTIETSIPREAYDNIVKIISGKE